MTYGEEFTIYCISLLIFLFLDFLWLGLIAKRFYQHQLGSIMRKGSDGTLKPRWLAAIVFYCLFVVGIVLFPVSIAVQESSALVAASAGALFGLISYATYDLTNYATMEKFPLKVVFVDLIWGTIVTMLTSIWGYAVYLALFY